MKITPPPNSSPSAHFPRGFGVVAAIALLAWLGSFGFRMLAGEQDGMFWSEVSSDQSAAWISFMLVGAAPLLLRFLQRLDFAKLGRGLRRHFPWLLAGSFLFYLLIMGVGARGIAYAPDEMGAILQARTFATGGLTPRVAPDLVEVIAPEVLLGDIIQIQRSTGRYTPTYWPGYALVMSPFALLHVQWACNALLTVLSLGLLWVLARRLIRTEDAGIWAALFALSSAQIALSAATYFSMPAHLLFNLLFVYFFIQNTRRGALAAGLVGSFALVLHNPVPHFSFALPWIVWLFVRRRSHAWPLIVGYLPIFLFIGFGWSAHLQSFDPGQLMSAGPQVAKVAANSRFAEIQSRVATIFRPPSQLLLLARGAAAAKFVVWATPGLAGLALWGWLDVRRKRQEQRTTFEGAGFELDYLWLLGVSLVFNFAIYFFVRFDQGHGWGFRYLHQSWLALPLLGAAFIVRQNGQWKRIAALWCALGIMAVIPLRTVQMWNLFSDALVARPPDSTEAASITFIRDQGDHSIWIQNDPFLRSNHWNLRLQSPRQSEVLARLYLKNAHRSAQGSWGKTWSGSEFSRPGSP